MLNTLNQTIECLKGNAEIITLLFAVVGGIFALRQWKTQIMHKRAEFTKEIISKTILMDTTFSMNMSGIRRG